MYRHKIPNLHHYFVGFTKLLFVVGWCLFVIVLDAALLYDFKHFIITLNLVSVHLIPSKFYLLQLKIDLETILSRFGPHDVEFVLHLDRLIQVEPLHHFEQILIFYSLKLIQLFLDLKDFSDGI